MREPDPEFLSQLTAARAGDEVVKNELFKHLRHVLRRMAGEARQGYDYRSMPSDLAQDVCLKAVEAFLEFRGNTRQELLAWARSILKNTIANLKRDARREKRDIGRTIPLGQSPCLASKEPPPDEEVAQQEDQQRAGEALHRLPARSREVLELWKQDRSFDVIGRMLGCSGEAVRKRLARAVDRLRQLN